MHKIYEFSIVAAANKNKYENSNIKNKRIQVEGLN